MFVFSWHRLAFSLKGDSVTLILDCNTTITRKLNRPLGSTIDSSGLTTIGCDLDNYGYFHVRKININTLYKILFNFV